MILSAGNFSRLFCYNGDIAGYRLPCCNLSAEFQDVHPISVEIKESRASRREIPLILLPSDRGLDVRTLQGHRFLNQGRTTQPASRRNSVFGSYVDLHYMLEADLHLDYRDQHGGVLYWQRHDGNAPGSRLSTYQMRCSLDFCLLVLIPFLFSHIFTMSYLVILWGSCSSQSLQQAIWR